MDNTNRKFFQDSQSKIAWIGQLFERYFNDQATDREKKIVENWDAEVGQTSYSATDQEVEEGCSMVWQRMSTEFGFVQAPKRKVIRLHQHVRYAVAASMVLFLGIGTYFYLGEDAFHQTEQVKALALQYFESGSNRKKMMLPDGSVIYLNNDTKIAIVAEEFDKQKREVWLEEGEAFFEVAKNPSKPFIVHNQNIETTVLGTSFNVRAYKELDESSVSVRDGKVEVRHQGKLLGRLTKNKNVSVNKMTGTILHGEANWEDAASWMENRLVMTGANTKELKLRLRQHFNVEVEIKGSKLQGRLLSSSFRSNVTLKEVLDGISMLYDIQYDASQPGKVILY